ncbi:MAG: NADP-dependent oxidoreductase [Alphaproteobacteria bacterium]
MSNMVNQQWTLAARPQGMVKVEDFSLVESDVPDVGEGQVLVRLTHIAYEPAMRGWIREGESYVKPVQIGEVMRAAGAGEVIESRHDSLKPGDIVSGMFGWQQYAVVDVEGALLPVQKLAEGVTPEMALSVLGITGLTAYYGMLRVGKPQAGETVVVSGAAGATGSIAGQIAKIQGCRVIGIAGGADKCRWLVEEAGFDGAIDYKSENVGRRMKELCPEGINVFYDNVGGEILEAALNNHVVGARIVLCGGISGYNTAAEVPPGPKNYMNLITTPATMQGFLLGQLGKDMGKAAQELGEWVRDGKINFAVDVQEGFENVPNTFLRLFHGQNLGKQLCKVG